MLMRNAEKIKPYIVGAIGGIAAAGIVSFSLGWVVTADTMNTAVRDQQVKALASVCGQGARAYWMNEGQDIAELDGWNNRDKRKQLAEKFASEISAYESLRSDVVYECSRRLES